MRTRGLIVLMVCLLGVGMLSGCATTTREDLGGLATADNPEYFAHPLRILALGVNAGGEVLQYGVMEPAYLLFVAPMPDFWGLTLAERAYWDQRRDEWGKYLAGQRPAYK